MADDNAGLLRNYVDGYAAFGDERFRDVALDIISFTRSVLSDPAGGFFASQDADVTPDDEGGYFTWTGEEFQKALDPDEYAVLYAHLFGPRGNMHHDPMKKVLSVSQSPEEIPGVLGKPPDEVLRIISRGKKKLLDARTKRETPFIDRTMYTSLTKKPRPLPSKALNGSCRKDSWSTGFCMRRRYLPCSMITYS
jgi:hypothetical protein